MTHVYGALVGRAYFQATASDQRSARVHVALQANTCDVKVFAGVDKDGKPRYRGVEPRDVHSVRRVGR